MLLKMDILILSMIWYEIEQKFMQQQSKEWDLLTRYGETALILAARKGHKNIVDVLRKSI